MRNSCTFCKREGFDVSFSTARTLAEHVESEHSDHAAGIDALISDTAAKLQSIYDNRTAGDFTFVGVLSEFARAVERELSRPHEPVAQPKLHFGSSC